MEKTIDAELFYTYAIENIDKLYNEQYENIVKASKIIKESIKLGGVLHVFGSGHSVGVGIELTGREGSLVPVHRIVTSDFVTSGKVSLAVFRDRVNYFERRAGLADQLYDLYNIAPQDVFMIISNSGINGLVIDLANKAKNMGHTVIVMTSWAHTSVETSRHPSGKKLYEFADIVIDNCGPLGDAQIPTNGIEKLCSISSITGAVVAQSITEHVCKMLADEGEEIPVLYDATRENYQEHNHQLLKKYEGRI